MKTEKIPFSDAHQVKKNQLYDMESEVIIANVFLKIHTSISSYFH